MLTSQLVNEIVDYINADTFYSVYVTATEGFKRTPDKVPIDKITFSVVPEENKSTYFEDAEANTCIKTDITIRLNVYAPTNRGGTQIISFAELITDYLADHYIGNLKRYEIGDLGYDDNVNAMLLPCRLYFTYTSCALETGDTDITSTVPDTFFCKSHINDTSVHLSADERTYIEQPLVIGSYTGNGASEGLEVDLGFRPKALILYRNSYHIASYSSADGISNCYAGVAIGNSYTRGVIILDSGFRVKTVATSNATSHLNDDGGSYTYIAFR